MNLHLQKGVVLPLNLNSLYPWEFKPSLVGIDAYGIPAGRMRPNRATPETRILVFAHAL